MQEGESIDDFDGCECGGNYIETNLYLKGYRPKPGFTNISLEKEGINILIGNKSRFINFEDIALINFEPTGKEYGTIQIKTENTKIPIGVIGIRVDEGKSFVDTVRKIVYEDLGEIKSDIISDKIEIYVGNFNRPYKIIGKVSARADSSLFSKTATMDDVNARLREEAVKLGANAIINAKYRRSSLTSWRGVKANGIAIITGSDEKKCPFCAEMIKIEAIKCKHCGSMLK